ncbi:hypothetical protein ACGFZP_21115 [Kitasatospora sp. NPDC048239]|uniref:hypothetical protein n=1 Tax=Kitasatospora sp. NPDC048239 TaxID=3364046 RepID=UPI00371B0F6E
MIMNAPKFTAEAALPRPSTPYGAPAQAADRPTAQKVTPAAHGVEVTTGHCGCLADEWFGASCICITYW